MIDIRINRLVSRNVETLIMKINYKLKNFSLKSLRYYFQRNFN